MNTVQELGNSSSIVNIDGKLYLRLPQAPCSAGARDLLELRNGETNLSEKSITIFFTILYQDFYLDNKIYLVSREGMTYLLMYRMLELKLVEQVSDYDSIALSVSGEIQVVHFKIHKVGIITSNQIIPFDIDPKVDSE
jgi:hypothetical protein